MAERNYGAHACWPTLHVAAMSRLDVVVPFAATAALLISVVVIYLRQGRNSILEDRIEKGEVGPITSFRGTLAVQESRPGFYLRLGKHPKGRRLQFLYRWVVGMGPQAMLDEVKLDASRRPVEVLRGNKQKSMPFAEFSAIRMREAAVPIGFSALMKGSVWHVELIPVKGSRLLFLSSEREDRQRAFEQTAAVAKAVSTVMSVPVQVVVDGNVF